MTEKTIGQMFYEQLLESKMNSKEMILARLLCEEPAIVRMEGEDGEGVVDVFDEALGAIEKAS